MFSEAPDQATEGAARALLVGHCLLELLVALLGLVRRLHQPCAAPTLKARAMGSRYGQDASGTAGSGKGSSGKAATVASNGKAWGMSKGGVSSVGKAKASGGAATAASTASSAPAAASLGSAARNLQWIACSNCSKCFNCSNCSKLLQTTPN